MAPMSELSEDEKRQLAVDFMVKQGSSWWSRYWELVLGGASLLPLLGDWHGHQFEFAIYVATLAVLVTVVLVKRIRARRALVRDAFGNSL